MTPTNEARLYMTLADILQVDAATLTGASSPDTIATWDSLAVVNLVAELEAVFDVQFDILEIADFHNVDIIKSILQGKGVEF